MISLIVTLALVIIADQASKLLIQRTMMLNTSVPVLEDLVRITYIRNPGAAFGIMLGNRTLFLLFSLIACGVMVYYFLRLPRSERWGRFALMFVLGGAIGNLIDRVRFGEVTDFIDIGYGHYRWPIFNFADLMVTIGVIVLFIRLSAAQRMVTVDEHPDPQRGLMHREDRPA